MEIRKLLAKNVRLYRDRLNYTQEELAGICNDILSNTALANRAFISDIENCRRNITLDKIEILAKALNVEPHELFLNKITSEKI